MISNVHLIGHSLGSHICGFAGERIPGLGRITGKDQIAKLVFDHIICDNLYAVDCNPKIQFNVKGLTACRTVAHMVFLCLCLAKKDSGSAASKRI
jgi:hypothetical protein